MSLCVYLITLNHYESQAPNPEHANEAHQAITKVQSTLYSRFFYTMQPK